MRIASRPPIARIALIDQAIREGGWPNAGSLARQLEVGHRTVQRDLAFLRDRLQAPLEFDSSRNGYYYTDPDFRLPLFRLTEGELVALFLAERVLRQYRGTPFEHDLTRAAARIAELLPEAVSLDVARLADTLSVTPTVLAPQDVETFRTLAAAVLDRRRLELDYFTASRNELTIRRIDPWHLTAIDADWYLIGWCHLRRDVRIFSTLRVRAARDTGETFDRPADFRIDQFLADGFRVLPGRDDHRILLRFTSEAAPRIEEKRWHHSQQTERTPDGSLLVRLRLSDLREIKRWVLFWGADCEVLEPPEFREVVTEEIAKLKELYGNELDLGVP